MSTINLPSEIPVNGYRDYHHKPFIFKVPSGQWETRDGPVSVESFKRRGWTVTNVSNPHSTHWNVWCR
jgi:hypothetical protein